MNLSVRSLSQEVFRGEVERVKLPGRAGSFEVLPGHAPIVALLEAGPITYRVGGVVRDISIAQGIARVSANVISVWLW